MAKIKFRDIFVKLGYLFPKDLYIINNTYVIGGNETEEDTPGYNFALLEPSVINVLNDYFERTNNSWDIIYISSVREFKDSPDKYIVIRDLKKQKKIVEKMIELNDNISSVDSWEFITDCISQKDIESMYDNGVEVTIDFGDYAIQVSKSIFPIVNKKTFMDMKIAKSMDFSADEYDRIIISYIHELFQFYLMFSVLAT